MLHGQHEKVSNFNIVLLRGAAAAPFTLNNQASLNKKIEVAHPQATSYFSLSLYRHSNLTNINRSVKYATSKLCPLCRILALCYIC